MGTRTGKITNTLTPVTGEHVKDCEHGVGVVVKQPKGGGIWVKFPEIAEPLLYTFRSALQEWRLFPAPASREGLDLWA